MFGDFKNLFEQAQSIQEQLATAQKQFATERVYGESGAGLVRIEFSGDQKAKSMQIDDSIISDPDMLAELIAAAINDGMLQIEHKKREHFEKLAKQYNIPSHMFPF